MTYFQMDDRDAWVAHAALEDWEASPGLEERVRLQLLDRIVDDFPSVIADRA